MKLNDIFSMKQRKQCKQAVLDKKYLFAYRHASSREKALGEFYFPEEDRDGEMKSDLEAIQKEILENLSKCHKTSEERNLLRNIIYDWRGYLEEWEDCELYWKIREKEFVVESDKKLQKKLAKGSLDKNEFRNELIEDYKDTVESHFNAEYGKTFYREMEKWLKRELDWRRKRSKGYKKRYKGMKFENVFDLHPSVDKIPWKGFEEAPNEKGLIELIYLVKQLYNLGLLNVHEEKRINAIIYNFFQLESFYEDEAIKKTSVSSAKGKVVSQPEDIKEDVARDKERVAVQPEDFKKKDGKDRDEKFVRIILSKIDPETHKDFLMACDYKKYSLEEGINEALHNFYTLIQSEISST